jgi:hypothetical protein
VPQTWKLSTDQQVPDQQLQRMLTGGTELALMFLDPAGNAIKAREQEEERPVAAFCWRIVSGPSGCLASRMSEATFTPDREVQVDGAAHRSCPRWGG